MSNTRKTPQAEIDDLQNRLKKITDEGSLKNAFLEVNATTNKELSALLSEVKIMLALASKKLTFINEILPVQNACRAGMDTLLDCQIAAREAILNALTNITAFTSKQTVTAKMFETDQTKLTYAYKKLLSEMNKFSKISLPDLQGSNNHASEISEQLNKLRQSIEQNSSQLNKFPELKNYVNSCLSVLTSTEQEVRTSIKMLNDDNTSLLSRISGTPADVEKMKVEIKSVAANSITIKLHLEKGGLVNTESIAKSSAATASYAASQKLFTAAAKPNGQVHPASANIQPNKPK